MYRRSQLKSRRVDDSSQATPFIVTKPSGRRARRVWTRIAALLVILILITAATTFILIHSHLEQWTRAYLVHTLENRYNARVELKNVQVALYPQVQVVGTGLAIWRHGQEQLPPFISAKSFSASGNLKGLLHSPWRIHSVSFVGLEIRVPPRGQVQTNPLRHWRALPDFTIGEIHADGTHLEILPRQPGKIPLSFEIRSLTLFSLGKNQPLSFRAVLTNPRPPGEIASEGKFGPWRIDNPRLTPVSGKYSFEHADLSIFHGISGILASRGSYDGILEHIHVQGSTDTPDFAVSTGSSPVHLTTEFQAVVDGTDGNTYLNPVTAFFGHSSLVASGKIEGKPGMAGKEITLDVSTNTARIEDLLRLAVKSSTAPMTGLAHVHSLFRLQPGKQSVVDRLYLNGEFGLQDIRFTDPSVQRKMENLSQHGRGMQNTSAESVTSTMQGRFQFQHATMSFSYLSFAVPGGEVVLYGTYGLQNERLNFHGDLRLQAKVSQTTRGFKSLLLKPIDPLFHKNDSGTVLPIRIEGKRSDPHFGLDIGRLVRSHR